MLVAGLVVALLAALIHVYVFCRSSPAEGGEHVTCSQSITKPMRLDLDFDVLVSGDELHGHSRAGRLPRSTVTGTRAG